MKSFPIFSSPPLGPDGFAVSENRAPLNLPAANAAKPEPSAQDKLISCVCELTAAVTKLACVSPSGHQEPQKKGCIVEASIDGEEHETEGGSSTISGKFKQANENIARLSSFPPSPQSNMLANPLSLTRATSTLQIAASPNLLPKQTRSCRVVIVPSLPRSPRN